jgi:transcriptional regulator with PAS, ATPase and Fis domain
VRGCLRVPPPEKRRELVESELFGYEDGAFTGARRGGQMGKIELADGGTLFLDEIGEMPLGLQAKLLRFLEERRVLRLGGSRYFPVNVRILAASNKDLSAAVQQGAFRQDLYYRLNVVRIQVPPLRERREDIPLLANFFLEKLETPAERNGAVRPRRIAPEAMDYLARKPWRGNVRELRNWIERALYVANSEELCLEECQRIDSSGKGGGEEEGQKRLEAAPLATPEATPPRPLRELEREAILAALRESHGNVTRAARALGISRPTIYEKMRRYGIADRSTFL